MLDHEIVDLRIALLRVALGGACAILPGDAEQAVAAASRFEDYVRGVEKSPSPATNEEPEAA
nr:hypothetical protein [uncultured Acidocella sp.]